MRTLILICLLTMVQIGSAQKNGIFVENFGNGGLISINYERQFFDEPRFSLRIGLGVSFFEIEEERPPSASDWDFNLNFPDFDWSIPISLQYLFDLNKNNYLETGLGYTFQFATDPGFGKTYDEKPAHVFLASFGFRRYFGQRKLWFWKVNLTPIIGIIDNRKKEYGFEPWAGISIGKRF